MSLRHRPEVFAGVPDALPPDGPGDLAVAPGLRAPRRRAGIHRGRGGRGGEEEVEAKPEEEEGVQLRGETAATTKQLGGRLVVVPDHSVTLTPPRRRPCVRMYKTLKKKAGTEKNESGVMQHLELLYIRCIFPPTLSCQNLKPQIGF